MTAALRVIAIGTLPAHPLWNERGDVRTGYTTTVLIESGDARIIVDPGLPATVLAARLGERTPLGPERITHVFVTDFQPDHRRGIELFGHAEWLLHEPERDAAAAALRERIQEAESAGDVESAAIFRDDLARLDRFTVAPDRIAEGVDLFPLPGVTPGNCGLLLPLPGRTVLITGDAVPTLEHLEQGKVLPGCIDVEAAQESFRESVEIADVLVLGRDNIVINPLRRTMM